MIESEGMQMHLVNTDDFETVKGKYLRLRSWKQYCAEQNIVDFRLRSIKGLDFGMNYGYLWYVFWHRHSFGSALGHRPWTDGRDTPRAHYRFRNGEKEHSEKRGKTK